MFSCPLVPVADAARVAAAARGVLCQQVLSLCNVTACSALRAVLFGFLACSVFHRQNTGVWVCGVGRLARTHKAKTTGGGQGDLHGPLPSRPSTDEEGTVGPLAPVRSVELDHIRNKSRFVYLFILMRFLYVSVSNLVHSVHSCEQFLQSPQLCLLDSTNFSCVAR